MNVLPTDSASVRAMAIELAEVMIQTAVWNGPQSIIVPQVKPVFQANARTCHPLAKTTAHTQVKLNAQTMARRFVETMTAILVWNGPHQLIVVFLAGMANTNVPITSFKESGMTKDAKAMLVSLIFYGKQFRTAEVMN